MRLNLGWTKNSPVKDTYDRRNQYNLMKEINQKDD